MAAPSPARRATFLALAVIVPFAAIVALIEASFRLFDIRPERYPRYRVFARTPGGNFRDYGNRWGMETLPDGTKRFHIKRPSSFPEHGMRMGEWVPSSEHVMVYADQNGVFDPQRGIPVKINSLGLRGPELSKQKPPNTTRILGLGDSFTFGEGVRDEDTFLRRMETALNQNTTARYEVLNAGVPGYNTRDEVLYLEHAWLELQPDLVLIIFYLNDAYDDAAFFNHGQALGTNLEQPEGLAESSYLYDVIQHGFKVREARRQLDEYYRRHYFTAAGDELTAPGNKFDWTKCRAAFERAKALSVEKNFKLALVIFPELRDLDENYPFHEIHQLVKKTAAELSIPALDLFDAFRGQDPSELWVHISDQHPNARAHELAAGAILAFLREQKFLP